jgi:hypothetical protein
MSYEVDECPICLIEYTSADKYIETKCGHKFCKGCILEWLENTKNCPLCGRKISMIKKHKLSWFSMCFGFNILYQRKTEF